MSRIHLAPVIALCASFAPAVSAVEVASVWVEAQISNGANTTIWCGRMESATLARLLDTSAEKGQFVTLHDCCWRKDDGTLVDPTSGLYTKDVSFDVSTIYRIATLRCDPHSPEAESKTPNRPAGEVLP